MGGYLNKQNSYSQKALIVIPIDENAVEKGEGYSVETIFDVANGETLNIIFDPTLVEAAGQRFTVHPTRWGVNTGYVEATLGICTSYTGGTAIESLNDNYFYATSKKEKTVVRYGITTDLVLTGYTASNTMIPIGTESTNQNAGGGQVVGGSKKILSGDLIYVFQIPNDTGSDIRLSFFVDFYESDKVTFYEDDVVIGTY